MVYHADNRYPHVEPVQMVKSTPPLSWGETIGGLVVLLLLIAAAVGIVRWIFSPTQAAPVIVNNVIATPSAPPTVIEKPVYVDREKVVERRVEIPVVVEREVVREKRVLVDRPVYIDRPVVIEKTVVVPRPVVVIGTDPACLDAAAAHAERVRTYRTIIR